MNTPRGFSDKVSFELGLQPPSRLLGAILPPVPVLRGVCGRCRQSPSTRCGLFGLSSVHSSGRWPARCKVPTQSSDYDGKVFAAFPQIFFATNIRDKHSGLQRLHHLCIDRKGSSIDDFVGPCRPQANALHRQSSIPHNEHTATHHRIKWMLRKYRELASNR